jgi:hypothetical protein
MTAKQPTAKELAEQHWLWLESLLHKVYVDAMIHGIKHGAARRKHGNTQNNH